MKLRFVYLFFLIIIAWLVSHALTTLFGPAASVRPREHIPASYERLFDVTPPPKPPTTARKFDSSQQQHSSSTKNLSGGARKEEWEKEEEEEIEAANEKPAAAAAAAPSPAPFLLDVGGGSGSGSSSNKELFNKCASWSNGDEKKRKQCFKVMRLTRKLEERARARGAVLAADAAAETNQVLVDYLVDLAVHGGEEQIKKDYSLPKAERKARLADAIRLRRAVEKQRTPDHFFHDSLQQELAEFDKLLKQVKP